MDGSLDMKVDEGWQPYTVLAVSGEIDISTAPRLREKILELVGLGVSQLVLDMSGVGFLDSTGLGVLVGALKRLRSVNGDLGIVCSDPDVMRVFTITGLDNVFRISETIEAAIASPATEGQPDSTGL